MDRHRNLALTLNRVKELRIRSVFLFASDSYNGAYGRTVWTNPSLARVFYSSKLPITAKGVAASRPPSTGMITPEIQRDSSLAK